MRDAARFRAARRSGCGLPQRDRASRLACDQRPGVEEGREVDHVVVEGVGDVAFLEGARSRKITSMRTFWPAGMTLRSLGSISTIFGQHLAHAGRLGPERLVVAEDLPRPRA